MRWVEALIGAFACVLPHLAVAVEAANALVRHEAPASNPDIDEDIFSDAKSDEAFGDHHVDAPAGLTRRRRRGQDLIVDEVWQAIKERIWKGEKCFHGDEMIVWPIEKKNGSEIHLHAIDYGAQIALSDVKEANPTEHKAGYCGSTIHMNTVTVICEHAGGYVAIRPLHHRAAHAKNFTICDVKFDGVAVTHPPAVGAMHVDPLYEDHLAELARLRAEEEARSRNADMQRTKIKSRAQGCSISYLVPLVTVAVVVVTAIRPLHAP